MKVRNITNKQIKKSVKDWSRAIRMEKRNRYKVKFIKRSFGWNKSRIYLMKFTSKQQLEVKQ